MALAACFATGSFAQKRPESIHGPSVASRAPEFSAPASEFSGPEACKDCHKNETIQYEKTGHSKIVFPGKDYIHGCETCHGPGKAHGDAVQAAHGDDAEVAKALVEHPIFAFKGSAGENAARCLTCHTSSKQQELFEHSAHAGHGISCGECHSAHLVDEVKDLSKGNLSYHLFSWWSLDADYRYTRFTSNSTGNYQSLFNGTTAARGSTNVIWCDGLSELAFSMDFTPIRALIIRPGVQFMKSDVESLTNGVIVPAITLRTNTVRPEISFGYEPSKLFSIRGDFHSTDNGSSYTAITPHTQEATHFVLRVHPLAKLTVEDEVSIVNNKLLVTNFQNDIRSNAITVSYSLGERFSVFGGFSYDSYLAQGNILYARGTPPLADSLRDQELDRVWSGGIEAKPTKRIGLRLTGKFDRSSGVGAISGEPPAYGPSVSPLVTGTAYYNFPVVGQLAVDLQRTYYDEQIVTVNNFSANLLTIRWTKGF